MSGVSAAASPCPCSLPHTAPALPSDIKEGPFEVAELGWGEFEVGVKLFFFDDSVKPLAFKHMLKLYPPPGTVLPAGHVSCTPPSPLQGATPHSSPSPQPVVSESFDEVVFNHPTSLTEEAFTRLTGGPAKYWPREGDDAYFNEHVPDSDLGVLAGAHAFVRSETEREWACNAAQRTKPPHTHTLRHAQV